MASAYGTWKQWRRRVATRGSATFAIDSAGFPNDDLWLTEHLAHASKRRREHRITKLEAAQAIADRRAG